VHRRPGGRIAHGGRLLGGGGPFERFAGVAAQLGQGALHQCGALGRRELLAACVEIEPQAHDAAKLCLFPACGGRRDAAELLGRFAVAFGRLERHRQPPDGFGAALVPRSVAARAHGVAEIALGDPDARHPISVIHRSPLAVRAQRAGLPRTARGCPRCPTGLIADSFHPERP